MVLNLFAEGSQIQITTLLESTVKEILTQVYRRVLFHGRTNSVPQIMRAFVEGRTKGVWEPHAALITMVEYHCSR